MAYKGEHVWNTGTAELVRRLSDRSGIPSPDGFTTYPGHGGSREDPLRCVDVWGTKEQRRKLVDDYTSNGGALMVRDNVWYIVHDERIYSRTYPELLNGLGSGKRYNAKSNSASDRHTNHAHFSTYASGAPKPLSSTPTPAPRPTVPVVDKSVLAQHWSSGHKSETVRLVQHGLKRLGYDLDDTGVVGSKTRAAAKLFAKRNNLTGYRPPGSPGMAFLTELRSDIKAKFGGNPFTVQE